MRVLWRITALLLALCLPWHPALAEKQVVLSFLGDCTIGNEEWLMGYEDGFAKVAEREGYGYFFQNLRSLLMEDDLTIANFEGVLKGDAFRKARKTYRFRGLPEYAQILRLGSVEAVSLANNHTLDYGKAGYQTTWQSLEDAGIIPFDTATPYLYEKDGVRVGLLGIYAAGFHSKRKAVAEAVKDLRQQGAQAVVVMVHAGQEYASLHNRTQTLAARLLVDAGADVVIGSHPHVLQGVEVYKQRNILYSIGNFVFGGNRKVRSLETVVARVTLTFDDQGVYLGQKLRLYPAHISGYAQRNDYQPRLVTGEAAEAVYARIDGDSVGMPAPAAQTDAYREYPYLDAAQDEAGR